MATDPDEMLNDREPQLTDGPDYHADHQAWEERQIRKARSLQTSDPLWGTSGPDKKHFKLSGAAPTEAPSTGVRHGGKNKSKVCKKSPDHEHHFEVVADRVYWRSEHMVDQCSYCGKKKGYGFNVWIVKPDWIKKLEARREKSIFL